MAMNLPVQPGDIPLPTRLAALLYLTYLIRYGEKLTLIDFSALAPTLHAHEG